MNQDSILTLAEFILKQDNFAIACHENPDGDSLGSLFALKLGLEQIEKCVQATCVDSAPPKYRNVFGVESLLKPYELAPFSHLICVDCADLARTGFTDEAISSVCSIINIDHHASNQGYGQFNLLSSDCATGMLIYGLLKTLGVVITQAIANNLFIAISADTGHFSHANTDSACLSVASELVGYGANPNLIAQELFQTTTLRWIALLGRAIHSLELHCNGKAALMSLKMKDFEAVGATSADVEGIIDYARNIESVEVAALLRETSDGFVKVSLRSKDLVDVGKISTVFTGGGHMRAAGYSIESSLAAAKHTLIKVLKGLQS